ncbi:hypothetical protein CK203_085396 [Vitis vinifera]|uniref:Secreted protein n=1 Tax=Vitis vinifera TaxID=29760 RepID=A0A438E4F5_VITVI|nr:hypothetical protein CK203_085396 [Vitis vinifera]
MLGSVLPISWSNLIDFFFLVDAGNGFAGTHPNSIGVWTMAFNGPPFRNCPDFYIGGLLLLLCEEPCRWTTGATPPLWSGVS